MFVSFFLPLDPRPDPANWLWVFYKQLSEIASSELHVFAPKQYFEAHVAELRWELKPESQASLGYRIPAAEDLSSCRSTIIPDSVLGNFCERHSTRVRAWKTLLTEPVPELVEWLETAISDLLSTGVTIEAFLTWVNCPSLSAVAARYGISVIHNELSPLRGPHYLDHAYFDFSGVNGGTEAEELFEAERGAAEGKAWDALLREFLAPDRQKDFFAAREREPEADLGVALQVEDDSNIIAFSGGAGSVELIFEAAIAVGTAGKVLVRPHPASRARYRLGPPCAADVSANCWEFIGKSRRVASINSSVSFEALLLEREASVLGECSFGFLCRMPPGSERRRALRFFLKRYLVPWDLLFATEYMRFRLTQPAAGEIVARHDAARKVMRARVSAAARRAQAKASPPAQPSYVEATSDDASPTHTLEMLESQLEERSKWALSLDAELATTRAELKRVQDELEERSAWAVALDAELVAARTRFGQMQAEFDERTAWAQSLDREVVSLRQELERRGAELEKYAEEKTKFVAAEARAASAETRIASVEAEVERLRRTLQSLQAEFDERSARVRSLEAELAAAYARLGALQAEFDEKAYWAVDLDQELHALRNQHDALKWELTEAERESTQLRRRLEGMEIFLPAQERKG